MKLINSNEFRRRLEERLSKKHFNELSQREEIVNIIKMLNEMPDAGQSITETDLIEEIKKAIEKLENLSDIAMKRWEEDKCEVLQHGKALAYILSKKILSDILPEEGKE